MGPVISSVPGASLQIPAFVNYYIAYSRAHNGAGDENTLEDVRPCGNLDNIPSNDPDIDHDGNLTECTTVSETIAYLGWLLITQNRREDFLALENWTRNNLVRNSPNVRVFGLHPATFWQEAASLTISQRHWTKITLPDRFRDNNMFWRFVPSIPNFNFDGVNYTPAPSRGGILSYQLRWSNETDRGGIYGAPDADLFRAANLIFAYLQGWDRSPEAGNPADQACLTDPNSPHNLFYCDAHAILRDADRAYVRWFEERDASVRPYLFAGDQHVTTGRMNHSYYFPAFFRFIFPVVDPSGPWADLADAYYLSMHEASAARLNIPNNAALPLLPSNFVDFFPHIQNGMVDPNISRYYEAGVFGSGGNHNESDFSWDAARIPLRVAEDLYYSHVICDGNFPLLTTRYLTDPGFSPITFLSQHLSNMQGGYSHSGGTPADSSASEMRLATTATVASFLLYSPDPAIRRNAQQQLTNLNPRAGFWRNTSKYYVQQVIAQALAQADPEGSGVHRLVALVRDRLLTPGQRAEICQGLRPAIHPPAAPVSPAPSLPVYRNNGRPDIISRQLNTVIGWINSYFLEPISQFLGYNPPATTTQTKPLACVAPRETVHGRTLGLTTINRDTLVQRVNFHHLQHVVRAAFTALRGNETTATTASRDAALVRAGRDAALASLSQALVQIRHDEENFGPDDSHRWPTNPHYIWSYLRGAPQTLLDQLTILLSAYSERLMTENRPYPEMRDAIDFCEYLRILFSNDLSDFTNANPYNQAALNLAEAGLRLQIPAEGSDYSASRQVSLDQGRAQAFYRRGIELALQSINGFSNVGQVLTGGYETSRPDYATIYRALLTVADLITRYQAALPPNDQGRIDNHFLNLSNELYRALQNFNEGHPIDINFRDFGSSHSNIFTATGITAPAIDNVQFSWQDLEGAISLNQRRASLSPSQAREMILSMRRMPAEILVRQVGLIPQRQGAQGLDEIFAGLAQLDQAEVILRNLEPAARNYNLSQFASYDRSRAVLQGGGVTLDQPEASIPTLQKTYTYSALAATRGQLLLMLADIITYLLRPQGSGETNDAYEQRKREAFADIAEGRQIIRESHIFSSQSNLLEALDSLGQSIASPPPQPGVRPSLLPSESAQRRSRLSCLSSIIIEEAARQYRAVSSSFSYLYADTQIALAEIGLRTGRSITNEFASFSSLLPLAGAQYPLCDNPSSSVICAMSPRAFRRVQVAYILAQTEVSFANNHHRRFRHIHLDRAQRYLNEVSRLAPSLDNPFPAYFRLQVDLLQADIYFSRARISAAEENRWRQRAITLANGIACQFDPDLRCLTTPTNPYSFAVNTDEAQRERDILGFQPASLLAQVYQSWAISSLSWDYTTRALYWCQEASDYYSRGQRPSYLARILNNGQLKESVDEYIRRNYYLLAAEEVCRVH
ncbi:hypothetical protein HZB07_00255 [Candidatus Saganbacteria bacterium]|nr:hypothetical protein [Candidatus Saganbacteria bacterium]